MQPLSWQKVEQEYAFLTANALKDTALLSQSTSTQLPHAPLLLIQYFRLSISLRQRTAGDETEGTGRQHHGRTGFEDQKRLNCVCGSQLFSLLARLQNLEPPQLFALQNFCEQLRNPVPTALCQVARPASLAAAAGPSTGLEAPH